MRVALDDFGTGYNSLAILRSCEFDTVKLDRTFVNGLVTNVADKVIASAVIFAAHGLDARVVAEGVETEEQRAALATLQCDDAQGFFFGAAMSPEAFTALLKTVTPTPPSAKSPNRRHHPNVTLSKARSGAADLSLDDIIAI